MIPQIGLGSRGKTVKLFRRYRVFFNCFPFRNRLDEEDFDQPCMNPEAPDPPPEERPGGSGDNKSSAAGGGGGAPDYAALLQYLQFYQKQMEETKK